MNASNSRNRLPLGRTRFRSWVGKPGPDHEVENSDQSAYALKAILLNTTIILYMKIILTIQPFRDSLTVFTTPSKNNSSTERPDRTIWFVDLPPFGDMSWWGYRAAHLRLQRGSGEGSTQIRRGGWQFGKRIRGGCVSTVEGAFRLRLRRWNSHGTLLSPFEARRSND